MAPDEPDAGEVGRALQRLREDVKADMGQMRDDVREDFREVVRRIENLDHVPRELYRANREADRRDLNEVGDIAREARRITEDGVREAKQVADRADTRASRALIVLAGGMLTMVGALIVALAVSGGSLP